MGSCISKCIDDCCSCSCCSSCGGGGGSSGPRPVPRPKQNPTAPVPLPGGSKKRHHKLSNTGDGNRPRGDGVVGLAPPSLGRPPPSPVGSTHSKKRLKHHHNHDMSSHPGQMQMQQYQNGMQ